MNTIHSATRVLSLSLYLACAWAATPAQAQVARFDALTDTISIAGQTVLGTTATYEARLMLQPGGGGSIYIEQGNATEDKRLVLNDTGPAAIGFTLGQNQTTFFTSATVTPGVFHHVAFVRDGGEERLYLDGSLLGSRGVSGDIDDNDSTAPAVGARFFQDTAIMASSFIGDIDTLRISNVARYSGASFAAPTGDLATDAGTLILYNFSAADLSGNQLADLSGNGHTGTLGTGFVGATPPVITSAVPEPTEWSLLLAGVGALLAWRMRKV